MHTIIGNVTLYNNNHTAGKNKTKITHLDTFFFFYNHTLLQSNFSHFFSKRSVIELLVLVVGVAAAENLQTPLTSFVTAETAAQCEDTAISPFFSLIRNEQNENTSIFLNEHVNICSYLDRVYIKQSWFGSFGSHQFYRTYPHYT